MPANCAYCWVEKKMTREHAYQRWLLNLFPNETYMPFVFSGGKKKYQTNEFTIKDVCWECNNTTLSQWDDYGKKIIEKYFSFTDPVLEGSQRISLDGETFGCFALKILYNLLRFTEKSFPVEDPEKFIYDSSWFRNPYMLDSSSLLRDEFIGKKRYRVFLWNNSLITPHDESQAKLAMFGNISFIHEDAPGSKIKNDMIRDVRNICWKYYLKIARANIVIFLFRDEVSDDEYKLTIHSLRKIMELYGFIDVMLSDYRAIENISHISVIEKEALKKLCALPIKNSSNSIVPEWKTWIFTLYWNEHSHGRYPARLPENLEKFMKHAEQFSARLNHLDTGMR